MKKILSLLYLVLSITLISAQTDEEWFGSEDDDLFGGDSLIEESEDSGESEDSLDELLLVDQEGIRIGGNYRFSFSSGGRFDPSAISSWEDITWSFDPDLSATLFFDARPASNIRAFGKLAMEYPFRESEDNSRSFDDIIQIKELFSDFNVADTLFFRAGKQTINWGVGYFFSPADLLNLSEIDPENPELELEGPLSVKIHLPVNMNNFYLYTVIPEGIEDPSDLAFAPKGEVVLGGTEWGLGAYYRYGQAPAAMLTFTTVLWDIDFFGEGVMQYGSDKTFVVEQGGLYSLAAYDREIFFKATLGGRFTWSADEGDLSISATGQYYFNGEGYSDPSILTSPAGALFVGSSILAGDLGITDLSNRSRHYGAASLSVSPVEDLSFSVFWMGNFSDFSGMVNPRISWTAADYIQIGMGFPYLYGDSGDEYSLQGNSLSCSLEVSLGNTSF